MRMTDDIVLPIILRNTFTFADFYRRVDFMRELLEHRFFDPTLQSEERSHMLETYRGAEIRPEDRTAVAEWGEGVFGAMSAGNLHDRIDALKRDAEALPRLTLYVPILMNSANAKMVGQWCREHVAADVMLDLHVDPASTGGCSYVFHDVYRDFSFSYFVSKRRTDLVQLIRAYG